MLPNSAKIRILLWHCKSVGWKHQSMTLIIGVIVSKMRTKTKWFCTTALIRKKMKLFSDGTQLKTKTWTVLFFQICVQKQAPSQKCWRPTNTCAATKKNLCVLWVKTKINFVAWLGGWLFGWLIGWFVYCWWTKGLFLPTLVERTSTSLGLIQENEENTVKQCPIVNVFPRHKRWCQLKTILTIGIFTAR